MRERAAGVPGGNSRREGATRVDIGVERTHSCVHMYRFYLFRHHRSLVLLSVPGVPGAVRLLTLETKNVSKRSTSHSLGRHRDARRHEIVKMYHVRSLRRFCVHARVRVDVGRRICPGRFQFVTLEKCSRRNRRDERRRRRPRGRSRGSRSRGLG